MNALPFLFIPIYTHALAPSEYGVLELLNRSQELLILFFTFGLRTSVVTFFQLEASEPTRQKQIYSSAVVFVSLATLVVAALAFTASDRLSTLLFSSTAYRESTLLILLATCFEIVFQLAVLYLQSNLKSTFYVITFTARTVVAIALAWLFVYGFHWGLNGVLRATLIQTMCASAVIVFYVLRQTGVSMNKPLLKDMLAFGLPLLPGALVMFFLNNGDRYFLNATSSRDELGIYGLAYRLGLLTSSLVLMPFLKLWSASMITVAAAADGPRRLGKIGSYLMMACAYCTLGVSLFTPILLHYVTTPLYWKAARLVPVIGVAYLFYCFTVILDASFYVTKKTGQKSIVLVLSCLVVLPLYALLIPRYGSWGAAWATAIGFAAFAFITGSFSQRAYPIELEWGRLTKIAVMTFGLFFVGNAVPGDTVSLGFVLRVIVAVAFPLILWTRLFLDGEERAEAAGLVRSVWSRMFRNASVPATANS